MSSNDDMEQVAIDVLRAKGTDFGQGLADELERGRARRIHGDATIPPGRKPEPPEVAKKSSRLRRLTLALTYIAVAALLVTGFFLVNSTKSTCSVVGCPGWCQSGGISCGMPIPPGGWQHGQTAWR